MGLAMQPSAAVASCANLPHSSYIHYNTFCREEHESGPKHVVAGCCEAGKLDNTAQETTGDNHKSSTVDPKANMGRSHRPGNVVLGRAV